MCTILIADDDKVIHGALTHFLTSEGFNIITADNAFEAFNIAASVIPDLIISDIHMPGMSGFELRDKLKADARTISIPLIFLTADVTAKDSQNGESSASNLILTKPFLFEQILKSINQHIVGSEK